MAYLTAFIKNRTVQQLVIFTACQNLLWWLVGSTASTGTPLAWNVKLCLVGYGGLVAAGYFLILRHRFHSTIGPILVVAAATLGLLAAPSEHLIQLFAILLCVFLVLTYIPQLGLQSVYGLIVFSCLAACGVPVILFLLRNHYLSSQFLVTLLPIIASYLALFENYYLLADLDWRLTLITPAIFALTTLLLAFSWAGVLAILLVGGHWWLQRHLKSHYQLVITGVVQVLVGYLVLK
ncbi:hypothetical protein [Levilactobacillus zymae]|uniref:hypothetical protein n=1 Tax=Levilactobacillus zymae TaxID=267363 RepID=UPI0028B4FC73|nr:hypothetical protein [Levilactobacillus zymae]MDT6980278.1 hypothetical protein [Levilactobacillus zymae]